MRVSPKKQITLCFLGCFLLLFCVSCGNRRLTTSDKVLIAIKNHDFRALRALEDEANIKTQHLDSGNYAINYSLMLGDSYVTHYMIREGYDLNVIASDGTTPLGTAILSYPLALTKAMVEAGASVNPSTMTSPLKLSILNNRLEITIYLLEQGARFRSREEKEEAIEELRQLDLRGLIEKIEQSPVPDP